MRYTSRDVIPAAALFLLYIGSAYIGLSINSVSTFASPLWLPTGIAIAFLFLFGLRLAPVVCAGAAIVNWSVGASLPLAFTIGLGNSLESFAAVYILQRLDFRATFSRIRDAISFIATSFFACTISASIGVIAIHISGYALNVELPITWLVWFIGDVLGALILSPLLFFFLSTEYVREVPKNRTEAILLALLLAGVNVLFFWKPFGWLEEFPYLYPISIPLAWAALRFGARGAILATSTTAALGTAAILTGHEIAGGASLSMQLLYMQIFFGSQAAVFLMVAALVEERESARLSISKQMTDLEYAVRRIRIADKAKTDFLATLAHELRNPLAPIMSSLEIINIAGIKSPEAGSALSIIDQQVRTIARLLDDLLDISRISKKKLRLEKTSIDLGSAIARSLETVGPLMRAHNHNVHLEFPTRILLWIEADPVRVEQIMVNLLNNAAKYTTRGGTIRITCALEDSYALVCVKDNGVGIAPAMLERIFEPFLQLSNAQAKTHGLGIGLSLTKQLVELHGGTIEARSDGLGQGAEFRVRLPLSAAPLPMFEDTAPKREAAAKSSGSQRVLVVDDNEAAAETMGALLHREGHVIRIAYSGRSALKEVSRFDPDIVVLDIGLPDMNGYDVASKIREFGKDGCTLIALTGYGQQEDRLKSKKAGFDFHLVKPVRFEDVLRCFRTAHERAVMHHT